MWPWAVQPWASDTSVPRAGAWVLRVHSYGQREAHAWVGVSVLNTPAHSPTILGKRFLVHQQRVKNL